MRQSAAVAYAQVVEASDSDSGVQERGQAPSANRRLSLQAAVRDAILAGGIVEREADDYAIVRFAQGGPNHIAHFICSLLTLGLWLFVWLYLTLTRATVRRWLIVVDETGTVSRRLLV